MFWSASAASKNTARSSGNELGFVFSECVLPVKCLARTTTPAQVRMVLYQINHSPNAAERRKPTNHEVVFWYSTPISQASTNLLLGFPIPQSLLVPVLTGYYKEQLEGLIHYGGPRM